MCAMSELGVEKKPVLLETFFVLVEIKINLSSFKSMEMMMIKWK